MTRHWEPHSPPKNETSLRRPTPRPSAAPVPSFGPGDGQPTSSRRQRPCPAMPLAVGAVSPLRPSARPGGAAFARRLGRGLVPGGAVQRRAAGRARPGLRGAAPPLPAPPRDSGKPGPPESCPTRPCRGAGEMRRCCPDPSGVRPEEIDKGGVLCPAKGVTFRQGLTVEIGRNQ